TRCLSDWSSDVCSSDLICAVSGSTTLGKPSNSNGFRHHRPKEKRGDASAPPRVVDPDTAQIDYADNERGAINKLLALNEYYRSRSEERRVGKEDMIEER